jgi:hypothetical protein
MNPKGRLARISLQSDGASFVGRAVTWDCWRAANRPVKVPLLMVMLWMIWGCQNQYPAAEPLTSQHRSVARERAEVAFAEIREALRSPLLARGICMAENRDQLERASIPRNFLQASTNEISSYEFFENGGFLDMYVKCKDSSSCFHVEVRLRNGHCAGFSIWYVVQ